MFQHKIIGFWAAVILAIGLSACSKHDHNGELAAASKAMSNETVTQSKLPANAKTYLVATEASYAPYEFRGEHGEVIGFDVDLLTAIGEKQGFKVQFLTRPWDGIFDTLNTGERDIVAASVRITDERKQTMDFSDPYYAGSLAFAVREDSGIKSIADLRGKKIAVLRGSAGIEDLPKSVSSGTTAVEDATLYLAFKTMVAGKADAAYGDIGVLQYHMKGVPDQKLLIIKDPNAKLDAVGFVVKKGRKDLLNQINAGLKEVIADGTYDKIAAKWFGKDAEPLPTQSAASEPAAASAPKQ